ncbi:hypothetical protein BHE90_012755 [Fusarium euwallaceae]|uniref:Uncharacterized protein n=5 Tax=Fusarium solani species complex TaxID=232080 RepID=A0A3M2SKK8_9HYPO|nr:hypothetical protein CDV36_002224 [Fusarium kuroshium]RSL83829.1 hypothetical protein CEP51_004244 [Fusarium floridanum]RSM00005.1 hypothetical protein CEP52_009402 [Fusarium oligoseptatum]RSM14142.1 hypothetical protein CDV31_005478 [Fusarium ambrosium]RTE72807.1 hypothetical protein BHE90_012755 [Fusarium euwallaceae]
MKFTAALLFLIPLAAAGPAKQSAEVLPELSSASAGEDRYDLGGHGDALQLAAVTCPANYPRYCSIGGFCCRTKKCCKYECCKNTARYCSAGRCYL